MSTRIYEITSGADYLINTANIYNLGNRIEIIYSSLTEKLQIIKLGIDGDENNIDSFVLKDEHTLFIIVKCNEKINENYKKCELQDLFVPSINPILEKSEIGTSSELPQQESIMKFQHWCGTCQNG